MPKTKETRGLANSNQIAVELSNRQTSARYNEFCCAVHGCFVCSHERNVNHQTIMNVSHAVDHSSPRITTFVLVIWRKSSLRFLPRTVCSFHEEHPVEISCSYSRTKFRYSRRSVRIISTGGNPREFKGNLKGKLAKLITGKAISVFRPC